MDKTKWTHKFVGGLHLLVIAVLLAVALGLSPIRVAQAATFMVNDTGDAGDNNPGDGTCATAGGVCTLRAAIEEANALAGDDTINFSVTGTITVGGAQLTINSNLTITGPGADQLTISGNDASRVFYIGSGTVTISGLTIADGNAAGDFGGGVYNFGDLTFTNCTVSGNTAVGGGGISNGGGADLTLTNCTVTGNKAAGAPGDGGGIYNYDGDVTLTNCTVSGNEAGDDGGGIYNDYGTVTLTDCTVSGNEAQSGGGIHNYDGDVTLTDCTFSGNSATDGGGIRNLGTLTVVNSTFSGNSASNCGGGICNEDTLNVTNSTFSDNSAGQCGGGGILNEEEGSFKNTIIANNTATGQQGSDCCYSLDSYGYNLVEDTNGCTINEVENVGTNITGQDPNLGPLQDNGGPTFTHALLSGSPAIDAASCKDMGDNDVTQDQRGVSRPQPAGGNCDIGAYEVEPGTIIVEKQTDPDGASGSFTFSGDAAGTISDDGQIVVANLVPGTYTATEANPAPAFDLTSITCDDGGSAAPSTWDVGTRTATIKLEEKETVTCTFTNTKQYILAVIKTGGGSGTVTSDPAGIFCGGDCTKYYAPATVVTLRAHPGVKSYFVGWSDDCSGTDPTTQVTMDADKTCTATFGYPVGGVVVPVDKVGLVAPWMGLVTLAGLAGLGVMLVRKRRG